MNTDATVLKQDMTQEWVFEDDGYGKTKNPGTDIYYQITGYHENNADKKESTLTCCGNRLTTYSERVLDWLAAVGGFAGLVHAFFYFLSGQEFTGCGNETDDENQVSIFYFFSKRM